MARSWQVHQPALLFDYSNNTTSLSQKKSTNTRKKRLCFTHNLKVEMQMMLAYHFGFPGHACPRPASGKVWDRGCEFGKSECGAGGWAVTRGPSKNFWEAAKILFVNVLLVNRCVHFEEILWRPHPWSLHFSTRSHLMKSWGKKMPWFEKSPYLSFARNTQDEPGVGRSRRLSSPCPHDTIGPITDIDTIFRKTRSKFKNSSSIYYTS